MKKTRELNFFYDHPLMKRYSSHPLQFSADEGFYARLAKKNSALDTSGRSEEVGLCPGFNRQVGYLWLTQDSKN